MKKLACLLAFLSSAAHAQSVQQSGQVTPGHIATWVTNGVIIDGGIAGGSSILGSYTTNDMLCANVSGSIIDCGLSATGTNNWVGLQNLNGGATAPTRSPGDNTTNVATTAFVTAGTSALLASNNVWTGTNTFNGGVAGNNTVNMINTTTPALTGSYWLTPGYSFNDAAIAGFNFSDAAVHSAFVITGNTPATGTGSYAGLFAQEFAAGRDASSQNVAMYGQINAISGDGRHFGGNSVVYICGTAITSQCPLGAANVTAAISFEADTTIATGGTSQSEQAFRIAQLGPVAGTVSVGIQGVKATASPGYKQFINLGENNIDNNFPLTTTGTFIKGTTNSRAVDSVIDVSAMAGGFTSGVMLMPATAVALNWNAGTAKLIGVSGTGVAVQFAGSINAIFAQAASTSFSGFLQSGNPGTNSGAIVLQGLTTGQVTIEPGNANSGTFNFNLPVTAGTAGQLLTSQGGTTNAMTWSSDSTIIPLSSAGNAVAQNATVFEVTNVSVTEANIQSLCPKTGSFKNLYLATTSVGGSGQTLTATWRTNGGDSSLTCQIATGAGTCNDTTHTAACTAGQTYSMKIVTSATTGSIAFISGGVEFDSP